MTRDDIIRMAREAGLYVGTNLSGLPLVGHREPGQTIGLNHISIEELERFAALVAAAEREACAKVADEVGACSRRHRAGAWDAAAAIRARSGK